MHLSILKVIVITLGAAVLIALAFRRFKMPLIIGFLITGILAGPSCLSLLDAPEEIATMAEIGVILLLFIIGLEISLKSLFRIKKIVFLGGFLQVGLTLLFTAIFTYFLGFSYKSAVFTGNLIALSSSAICLNLLSNQGAVSTPHGKVSLAFLIFQDIIIVPMMLLVPILSGQQANVIEELFILAGKGLFIVLFLITFSKFIIPWLLYTTARGKNNELFLHTIVVICFAVAWMTNEMGLSLALGAFMAGLMISESDYSYQATSIIIPFREIFTSFFFISVGMLMDLQFFAQHFLVILILVAVVMIIKTLVSGFAAFLMGFPLRTCIMVGMLLFQIGEFSFILADAGLKAGLLPHEAYQYFLSVSIITMAITPFIYRLAPKAAELVATDKKSTAKTKTQDTSATNLTDHLIIIGYGINGRNLAKAAKVTCIPYQILELNPVAVREAKAEGEPIIYGDAIYSFILSHVQVHKARVVVIAITDPLATKRIISSIRSISKSVQIIARTRFVAEVEENLQLGANEVIPEEFETSLEILNRVMHKYLIPEAKITDITNQLKATNSLRNKSVYKNNFANMNELQSQGLEITAVEVQNHHKEITEIPLYKADLRGKWGITIIAIKRHDAMLLNIDKETELKRNDILYLFGKHEDIDRFREKISL